MQIRLILKIILTVMGVGVLWKGYDLFLKKTPEPRYELIGKDKEYELRMYGPNVFAQVTQKGELDEAGRAGFMLLADYIFARKASHKTMAMTAPVMFLQDDAGWITRFVLPDSVAYASAPKPYTNEISLVQAHARVMAVAPVPGPPSPEQWRLHEEKLRQWIKTSAYRPCGQPWYARYNPPWIPAFMRRNEILMPVEKANCILS